jgi:putative two-component system response regulator
MLEHREDRLDLLLVEDDEEDYLLTKDLLSELDGVRHELHWVSDYRSALEAAQKDDYDVCLVDYRLGGVETGLDLVRALVSTGYSAPIILLTGQGDRHVDVEAQRAGAADYLVKGEVSPALLERTIRFAIRTHAALQELQDSYRATVRALATALELRDDQTGAHATRVTELALQLTMRVAPELAADPELEFGFLLHDIGKIGITDAVVLKPGPFDPNELSQMRQHVALGQQIIAQLPDLSGLAHDIVAAHHERWDGTGYPHGLCGEEIPLASRIFAIVDAFDAITNDRPYRSAQTTERALNEISRAAGKQFDPAIVEAFLSLIREETAAA